MTRNEKDTINRRTENRHLFQRMKRGLESVRDTPHKRVLLAAYLIELAGIFGVEKADFSWRKVIGMAAAIVGVAVFQWE